MSQIGKAGSSLVASAVSIVTRIDGKVLVVWNQKQKGWVLPGGKVEEGESVESAQRRELHEETSLATLFSVRAYEGLSCVEDVNEKTRLTGPNEKTRPTGPNEKTRPTGRVVYMFLVAASGVPKEMEQGAPVMWMTYEDLVKCSPFRAFYRPMFAALEEKSR